MGVKVPNAAELVARKVKAWLQEARQDEVIVQVDLGVFLREEGVPALYPYAHACYHYSTPAILFGKCFELESSCGVTQQEDVCGPALFAIVLQKAILGVVGREPS